MTDIKCLNLAQLEAKAAQIRHKIIEVLSKNGGHLSSNLGAVEIILAMHYVFDVKKDPFIFDVSHQCYTHKLLTRRWDEFESLRKFNGISGFTNPKESEFDYFIAGHASTSISLALGACKAIKLKSQDRLPIAFIGDGALSGGMAYEALNELGDRKYPCVIILNDNEMSISKPIGAISKYLSQMMAAEWYQKFKNRVNQLLTYAPQGAAYMAKKFEEGFRLITPGIYFEELGLEYIGPVNGHNLKDLISAYEVAKSMRKPVIVHVQTIKGKGYKKAEIQNEHWHGVGPFDIESGEFIKKHTQKDATSIFSQNLLELATKHDNIVGITAAMPSGTGIGALIEKFPHRFWDVAIAEQHGVTSMAAMAKEGFKPFIAIYSTFLQRAYDQIIHDCAILNLNVVFAIDRAGIVGNDGETHQGIFDISYLNLIPNLTLFAPRDEANFKFIMEYAYKHSGVCAFRYPRGAFLLKDEFKAREISYAKGEILKQGEDVAFIGYGNGVGLAYEVSEILKNSLQPSLVDLVFAKPLDENLLLNLSKNHKIWYVFSQSVKIGGIGEILMSFLQRHEIYDVCVVSFEYDDQFITHGNTAEVEKSLQLDAQSIAQKITLHLSNKRNLSHTT